MKKTALLLIILFTCILSIFAGDSKEIKLTYHEESYQFFEISYANEAITKDTRKEVNLLSGRSEAIKVKYNANVGTKEKGITLNLIVKDGFKNAAAGDSLPVKFTSKLLYDSENNNVATVSVTCDQDNYAHVKVYDVEKYRGGFDVVELVATWDKDHKWIAGTYECPIEIWIGTDL